MNPFYVINVFHKEIFHIKLGNQKGSDCRKNFENKFFGLIWTLVNNFQLIWK